MWTANSHCYHPCSSTFTLSSLFPQSIKETQLLTAGLGGSRGAARSLLTPWHGLVAEELAPELEILCHKELTTWSPRRDATMDRDPKPKAFRDNPMAASSPGPDCQTSNPWRLSLERLLGNTETSKDLLWEFRRFLLKPCRKEQGHLLPAPMAGVKSGPRRRELPPAVIPCQSAPRTHQGFLSPRGPSLVDTKEGHATGQTPPSQWFFLSLPSRSALSGFIRSTAGFTGTCVISRAAAFLLC